MRCPSESRYGLFERLVNLCNDVSVLRLVGNVPQAFSHIAVINVAHNIADVMRLCEQRSESGPLAARLDRIRSSAW